MTALRVWLLRCVAAIGLTRGESRLQTEMQSHLDLLTDEYLARGLTPAEARAAARRDFGGVDQITEHWRDQHGLPFIDGVRQDVRFAWRTLQRSPIFAGSAILTLGLGIGANTAIFSLLDALLLKALPVQAPGQLYRLSGNYAYPSFRALQAAADADIGLLATAAGEALQVSVDGAPERTDVAFVSGSYFPVLGVSAGPGRTINADDEAGQPSPVAVLSDGFWRRRFAADPTVVGRRLQIGGQQLTIIGVAPRGFFGERVGESPDVWAPLPMRSLLVKGRDLIRSPGTAWLDLIARLPAGADLTARQVELTHQYRQILTGVFGPDLAEDERRDIAQVRVELIPAGAGLSSLRERFAQPLWLLMAAVVVVLAIACANVANLLLARAVTRQREIGLRLALGISRRRLVRQLLTEALVLATLGAAAGLLVAWGAQEVVLRLVSPDGVRLDLSVTPDARVLAFVAATTIGTALTVALVPAWQAARVDVLTALRTAGGRITGQGGMVRAVLVVVQVALSLVLLVAAALFVRTLSNLRQVDLGFQTAQQIVADVNPVAAGFQGPRFSAYCVALLDRLRQQPGVVDVSFSENGTLMGRDSTTDRLGPSGREIPASGLPKSSFDVVGPRYFQAMQIRLREGRDFEDGDSAQAVPVIAINESMARHFFGDQRVVGRRLRWDNTEFTIVAVTADVRGQTPRDAPRLQFYVPYFQHPDRATLASVRVVIRTAGDAGSAMSPLRAVIQAVDPVVPLEAIDLTETLVDRTLAQPRMIASLATAFGLLALGVASIGLYGVIAFGVASRTSELGLRLALGATRGEVVWLLTKRHLALVGAGGLIGLPLAIAAATFLDSQLFGVEPADPATAGVAAAVLLGAAMAAASVPTWRAARIQPVIALRHD